MILNILTSNLICQLLFLSLSFKIIVVFLQSLRQLPFQNLSSKIIIPYFQGYLLDPIALTSIAVSIFYNNND